MGMIEMLLKGIPALFSPQLMSILLSMGHGDEIVLADGNFPAVRINDNHVFCSGHDLPSVLDAIMQFLPLDKAVEKSVFLMSPQSSSQPNSEQPDALWALYRKIISSYEPDFDAYDFLPKPDFYERAKTAFAVVSTGEMTKFANIILRKGVVCK